MKRVLIFFLVIVAVAFFSADLTRAQSLEIGVAWVGKSGMAERVANGFSEGIQKLAPGTKIEYHKELSSLKELAKITAKWEKDKKGMILLRSNAAKWLAKNPPSIPTFIGGCDHPVRLGAVNNLQRPDGNITGVTYHLPVDAQFETFRAVVPNLKSVLLLLDERYPSSLIDHNGTKDACVKFNIKYRKAICSSIEDAVRAVKEYKDRVSAIIIGNQAWLLNNTEVIVSAAGKTPILSYSSEPVKAGALGGFAADDAKLGHILAQSVVDVLIKGKPVKNVPIKVDPDPKFYVNATTAQKIGIAIPYAVLDAPTVIE